jgi:hypothetical protein
MFIFAVVIELLNVIHINFCLHAISDNINKRILVSDGYYLLRCDAV